ncbi:hypothetical protein BGZ76_008439, partial [Entomortierella beljakovae]
KRLMETISQYHKLEPTADLEAEDTDDASWVYSTGQSMQDSNITLASSPMYHMYDDEDEADVVSLSDYEDSTDG